MASVTESACRGCPHTTCALSPAWRATSVKLAWKGSPEGLPRGTALTPREAMPGWIWLKSRQAGSERRLNARRRVRETMDSIDIMRYPGTRHNPGRNGRSHKRKAMNSINIMRYPGPRNKPGRNGRSHKRKAAAGEPRRCLGVLAAVALEY